MANWSEPKDNHQGGDEVTPEIFNNLAVNEKYLKGEKDKHDTRLTNVEGRATNLEKRATAVEGRATELEKRTDQAEKDIDAVEGRATSLESRSTALESRATQNENDIDALETRSSTHEGRTSTLEKEMDAVESRATAVEGRATELEKKTSSLETSKIGTADVQNANVDITQATTRSNLGVKETIKSVFGKIKKWFADLKALAFKDKVTESDIDGTISTSKVSGLHTVATSGSYNDLSNKPSITKAAVGLGNVANERQYSSANPPPLPTALADAGDSSKQIKAQYSGSWHGLTDGIAMWDGYKVVAVKYSDLVAAIKADIGGSTPAFTREVLWTSETPSITARVPSNQLVDGAVYEFRCRDYGEEFVFYQKWQTEEGFMGLNTCSQGYMTDSWFDLYVLCPEANSYGVEMYGVVFHQEADYPPSTGQKGYDCYQMSRIHFT